MMGFSPCFRTEYVGLLAEWVILSPVMVPGEWQLSSVVALEIRPLTSWQEHRDGARQASCELDPLTSIIVSNLVQYEHLLMSTLWL